jgi:uncharacterized membrane protein
LERLIMQRFRTITLVAATLATGFVASIFVHWSNTIMPGLRSTDDRTFVIAFQQLDDAITNPLFLGFGFTGALLFTGLAGALQWRTGRRTVLPWVVAAFVLYLVAFVSTMAVNVPLNEDLVAAAGDPDRIADFAAVRDELKESTWVAWNHVRAVASALAFGCLAWALVVYGRTSGGADAGADRVAVPEQRS